jgi:PAS domain S-box-containing protein
MKLIKGLFDISSTDPDDARRLKLLNVLLSGMAVIVLLGILAIAISSLFTAEVGPRSGILYASGFVTLACIVIVFLIGRYWSGQLASFLFLLLLTAVAPLTDQPQQVVNGRSLFVFTIPILMASVLLRPYASFVVASICGLIVTVIALNIHVGINSPAILGFFAIALVSWLSARSLEQALVDVRTINRELDQRVIDRTRELYDALTREHAEASKNQAILESIADGVIVFDSQGQAIVANPAVGRLLERSSDEIIRYRIERLMDGKVTSAVREQIVGLLQDEEAHLSNMRFEWGKKTLSASFAPVYADQNTPIGTVAVFRDFTREAEVERMKSDFVSMVSHELRTPLNAILGYAEILLEAVYGSLADRQRGVVARIMTNTKRLLSLVNDLLDQAQIEAGRLAFTTTAFTPNELVEGAHSLMLGVAQAKDLRLTYEVTEDMPPTLSGDPQRLHQILVNLINNAVKFTERGGIHVRLYRPDADHWALAVSDTGAGIAPEAQLHIFEPFWQAEETATRSHAGVGLGLSIVKKLVDLMKGEIGLSSELGRGSTFTITLPLTLMQEEII